VDGSELVDAFLKLVEAIGGKIGGHAAELVFRDLLGIQDEQLRLLNENERHLTRLLTGQHRSGRKLVELAARPGRSKQQRIDYLTEARNDLIRAYSLLDADTAAGLLAQYVRMSVIASDLSMVHGLLGEIDDQRYWAIKAWENACAAVRVQAPVVQETLYPRSLGRTIIREISGTTETGFWNTLVPNRRPPGPRSWSYENWTRMRAMREALERGEVPRDKYHPGFAEYYPEVKAVLQLHDMERKCQALRQVCLNVGVAPAEISPPQLTVDLSTKFKPRITYDF
jgi:hypothetical protein